MAFRLWMIYLTLICSSGHACAEFMRGADFSEVQWIEDHGVHYSDGGKKADPLQLFKAAGGNTVRLRLFVDPPDTEAQVNSLAYTLRLAKRVKNAGLSLLLDLHYSDGWADPSHQNIPAAWKNLSHSQLIDKVQIYTAETLKRFDDEGAMPDMVEVGNEITNGMIWPDGGPLSDPARWSDQSSPGAAPTVPWDQFTDLLKAGIRGLHDADPRHQVRVMIHIDKGGSAAVSKWFFENITRRRVSFDVIGLSYYPFWHGSLNDLQQNLSSLSAAYGKDIVVVETAFDTEGGAQGQLPFPKSQQGQADFIRALIRIVAQTPGGHGMGICYWAGGWIGGPRWNGPSWSGQWEQRALFNYDGSPRPALAAISTSIVGGRLPTRWAKEVSPANPLPDYPRPQMTRSRWQNLNGVWDFAVTSRNQAAMPLKADGQIVVPFPFESALSGSEKASIPTQTLWYRRQFQTPADWSAKRILLHFGAVNWQAKAWLNGTLLGEHRGGYDAFSFDVTPALKISGMNELTVAVQNPITCDTPDAQLVGKQRIHPGGVLYTACTGIWQTVWLEPVPETHIQSLSIVPDFDRSSLRVKALSDHVNSPITVTAIDDGKEIARVSGATGAELTLNIPNARPWTPDSPHMYQLQIRLNDSGDEVESYAALRKVSLCPDAKGRTRILLNNQFVFEVGALDQGYWPDGLYTAPTDDALKYDIELAKKLGFNLLRKHAKVESERWYYWADRLGMLVWQDVPQAFGDHFVEATNQQWSREMEHVIVDHSNHPSIIVWTLFNEGWGQHDTESITATARKLDPSRLIDSASGGYNQLVDGVKSKYRLPTPAGVGDINDLHTYPEPSIEKEDPHRALVCGEFGGISLRVNNHLWNDRNFGYGQVMRDGWHLTEHYQQLLKQAYQLRDAGASAVVYTQITDVEEETNGLLTYDRDVLKPIPQLITAANHGEFLPMPPAPPDSDLVSTSRDAPRTWSFSTSRPAEDWNKSNFDDSGWRKGAAPFGRGYPNIHTAWTDTPGDIWMRQEVTLPATLPKAIVVKALHDEDVEVYINGVLAAQASGYTAEYASLPMSPEAYQALKPGNGNVIAVHCHQTIGGQVIDVGLSTTEASRN